MRLFHAFLDVEMGSVSSVGHREHLPAGLSRCRNISLEDLEVFKKRYSARESDHRPFETPSSVECREWVFRKLSDFVEKVFSKGQLV